MKKPMVTGGLYAVEKTPQICGQMCGKYAVLCVKYAIKYTVNMRLVSNFGCRELYSNLRVQKSEFSALVSERQSQKGRNIR